MTSDRFNKMKAWAAEEMAIFDRLPAAIREAMSNSDTSIRASIVLAALLRGVSEEDIIKTISKHKVKP